MEDVRLSLPSALGTDHLPQYCQILVPLKEKKKKPTQVLRVALGEAGGHWEALPGNRFDTEGRLDP